MLNRRQFCSVIGASAASLAWARTVSPVWAEDKPTFAPGAFVDVHVHIGTIPVNKTDPLTAEDLLRWMDGYDISQAWVLPLVSPEAYPNPVSNEYVLEATKPHRDRLIPFCVIDPRNSWYGQGKALTTQVRRYVDQGAKGFGEFKVGLPIADPKNLDLYRVCGEVGIPALIHIDSLRNTDEPTLPGLERILTEFPDTIVIGHGPGTWATISGDCTRAEMGTYPKRPVAPGGALDRLMKAHKNFYLDLSGGSGANAIARDPEFGREFLIRNKNQVMFGTDYLTMGQPIRQQEVLRGLDLPEEVQAAVFRENARRMLGMI